MRLGSRAVSRAVGQTARVCHEAIICHVTLSLVSKNKKSLLGSSPVKVVFKDCCALAHHCVRIVRIVRIANAMKQVDRPGMYLSISVC